jgi:hypothetical protein
MALIKPANILFLGSKNLEADIKLTRELRLDYNARYVVNLVNDLKFAGQCLHYSLFNSAPEDRYKVFLFDPRMILYNGSNSEIPDFLISSRKNLPVVLFDASPEYSPYIKGTHYDVSLNHHSSSKEIEKQLDLIIQGWAPPEK